MKRSEQGSKALRARFEIDLAVTNLIAPKEIAMKKFIAAVTVSLSAVTASAALLVAPAAFAVESEPTHQTTGIVKKIDQEKGRVTLAHDPVPSLEWPGMTMGFAVEDQTLLENLEPGQAVEFDFISGKGGMFVITEISPQ